HKLLQTCYSVMPNGLPGNDRYGSYSNWYVMASIGLYPLSAIEAKYEISFPFFNNVTVQTTTEPLTIKGGTTNMDQLSFVFDGKQSNSAAIAFTKFSKGGHLEIFR
ncbi:MAG: glycoside hydrolase family 92 protein, partial [Bacteroidales bacterium]|nr:glycoside hydrolase family 92 protein [Bacteroidales bacterium]